MTSLHRPADPRSGLVISTHDLGRQQGRMMEVTRVADAPDELGNDVIGVPPGSPIALELRLESAGDGVLVTGSAEVEVSGECARCLTAISDRTELDVMELFLYPDSEADDEEASRLEGELIDLEPLIRDTVVLDLPFTPLCREDCAGLCPLCGQDLNAAPDHTHEDPVDPRLGALADWQPQTSSTEETSTPREQ
ncbi:DUF177 domain-containing protein [Desertihabitans brevis]|uniref:DUF177 domain-containing protein n=1 Tax=Desertihabitans brevis TaxID=2268447 RepID=A0A367YQP7_9ACTN|nr:DUF177 domain-containing protein [Desertihabitans brevis]RCK68148.1 DUF177 domain-containing protein [Desertihabitans brevis]